MDMARFDRVRRVSGGATATFTAGASAVREGGGDIAAPRSSYRRGGVCNIE